MDDQASWRERRREASAAQGAALERRRAAESEKARGLLREFVQQLVGLGVEAQALRAPVVGSGTTYRTNLTGWYLRRNKSLAVDADANFYILGTQPNLKARVAGLRVLPSDPPLIIGQGARDGESLPLEQLLRLRLQELAGE